MSLFTSTNFRKQAIAIACSLAFAPTFGLAADLKDAAIQRIEGNNDNSIPDSTFEGVVITSNGDLPESTLGTGPAVSYIQVLARDTNVNLAPDTGEINIFSNQVNITGTDAININTTGTGSTTIGGANTGDITLQNGGLSSLVVTDSGTAVTGILNSTGNFSVGGNKFTVDAITGNTLVGGTLGVTGATTLTGATQINNTLGVTGLTTTTDIANTGNISSTTLGVTGLSTLGAVTQVGTANINATGTAATNIGTAGGATNIGSAGSANTVLGTTVITGATTINGAGLFSTQLGGAGTGTVTVTSGTSSITTANTGNVIVGSAGNIVTATTGNNVLTATAGNNNITAFAVNNIEAPTNNIGVATVSVNTIGNNNASTTVTATGGNSTMSVVNGTASLRSGSGPTASGLTSTSAAQTLSTDSVTLASQLNNIGDNSSRQNIAGASYVNRLEGNTLINGNTYINGTLVYTSNTSATTTVTSGASVLQGAVQATTGLNSIANQGGSGVVVDANGKITAGIVGQTTGSLVITNGLGNTHGFVVTEDSATMSGGTRSSSLTLNDNGATFSDSASGAPVQVHGVADGTSDFDAVNVRQFSSAIASVTAMANIPQVDQDKTVSAGMAIGSFMGKTALAAGMTYRFTKNGVLKGSISSALNSGKSTAVGIGAAWSY